MKKEALTIFLFLILIQLTIAQSIETPIQKITYYAEEYEIGNINYPQLVVQMTSSREELSKIMGATSLGHDEVLRAEQLESALGEPTEFTKWIWIEGEEREKKLDEEIPAWRKIIFDGKKIQIWLGAWPNIVQKDDEDFIFYRLNLETQFKKPEEQLNIEEKIQDVASLAKIYSENPAKENLEALAKQSVSVEQLFNSNFNQNAGNCQELMNDILGNENKRENRFLVIREIDFYEGENFETKFRIEMCDDCDWRWINLNMWFESRGNFEHPEEEVNDDSGKEKYITMSSENLKQETKKLIEEIKKKLEEKDYESAFQIQNELRVLTSAWDEKANDVWEEVEDKYRVNFESMTEEEQKECSENYCWIKKEQERREAEKNIRKNNYEERKQFYSELFADYEKKEFSFEQEEWEKRLIEEFKEFGEEICDNNIDDNDNEQVDCSDSQCGGKICGYDTIISEENNLTSEKKVEMYCISGTCQQKEIIVQENAVCGNHICEEGEEELCFEDCSLCAEYEALACEGKVIFSGKDDKGCPLEPICLSEEESCEADEDCSQPLCANVGCVEKKCQVLELVECREAECIDGQEKIQNCQSGEELVLEKCIDELWKKTGIGCEELATDEEILPGEQSEEEISGKECVVKSDCGNENDVCSNGKCNTLPEIVAEEIEDVEIDFSPEETVENQEEQETENSERENEIEEREEEPRESQEPFPEPEIKQEELTTGNVIFSFFRTLAGKMKLTGFAVEEGSDSSGGDNSGSSESNSDSGESNPPNENIGEDNNEEPPPQETESPIFNDNPQEIPRDDFQGERDDREEDREDREGEDKERRENECGERCDRECYDMEIRPCSEDCIWKECGQELECNVDDVRTSCENKCKEENNLDSCKDECSEKCLSGENTWKEPEREEHKQEKFVFTLGGSCREAQGKTEGFIWFGGWGENFQDFHLVKNKYYSRGGTDWCADDLENLLKQRRELEKSFNEEFAKWFFEKYVANSAEDWENHISGIFELYWRDVDLSKQIAERYRCLRKTGLPEHNLINFKYETEYGSVEFWEEIKTTKLMDENSEDVEIISPYMKLWLFPSRDFFKAEMKRSMESHELPGDSDEEKGITEEEKNNLREDEEFMDQIRDFNENFGEDFVLQIKDFETDEIIFNVHMKINEEELIYFEPMPSDENPAENVKIELDSEKLLDIIEFQESDRVELESPPWDKQPRTGAVKGVVDGVQMYFKFRSLMNSAKVTPKDAEDNAIFFTRAFFEKVMGGEREEGPDMEGPGGCQNEEECEEYCSQPENREECSQFRDREEFPDSENREFLTGEVVRN